MLSIFASKWTWLTVSAGLFGASLLGPTDPVKASRAKTVDFNRDVRPILSEHCYKCHGPAVKDIKGDLKLNEAASATKDRDGKFVIKPGDSKNSMLLGRVTEKDYPMPPADSGMAPLTPKQIEILKTWIDQGAEYKPHWAFIPPVKPALPEVKDKKWPKNEIDRFILANLEANNLKPEAEADRVTLIRRATLALTGLQPTPEEVSAFLKDAKPLAYERLVDRLLASPRYGEHEARYWFDAVRYGDTHGLHLDNERSIYPYRDWVIRAINKDLPYDKFATWQLAGDLLPTPSTEQRIATGFVRMNPTTAEGGAIDEEFQAKNSFDRTEAFSTIFLGMTFTCARCHDHKYDPISHKDYFGLFAFFNSTADAPLDGNLLVPGPAVKARLPEQDLEARGYELKMEAALAQAKPEEALAWAGSINITPPAASKWEISNAFPAKDFEAAYAMECGPEPGGIEDKAQWKPLDLKAGAPVKVVYKDNASAFVRGVITSQKAQTFELRVGSDDGIKIWINGNLVHENKVARGVSEATDTVKVEFKAGENPILVKIINGGGEDGFRYNLGDVVAERVAILLKDPAKAEAELKKLFLENGPETPNSTSYRKAKNDLSALDRDIPMTLVAEELPVPRIANILKRGEYNLKGEAVQRAIPTVMGSLPSDAPVNRLGLAQWLARKDNPLFARVTVNRLWLQHFGAGIVKSAEDFGNQGDWPSNPDLLDYLAVRFGEDGWSMKKFHRLVVTSATFRQSSRVTPAKYKKDPENRLLARGPRFRLDAEVIRDQALFASGLLRERIGGKGFRPYQPEGLWEALAFTGSNTSRYTQDTSEDIYRRSLYLFWKRTSPHPVMLTFDAPMRETCVVRRSRTNTPMQALVTMNEPAFVEASRVMAERIISEKETDKQRMERAFMLTLGRNPSEAESKVLTGALTRYRAKYKSRHKEAHQLVSIGLSPRNSAISAVEAASWMMICSTLMNTDAFLNFE
ncbi:MAG: PSD1 and planctomycete cytochrome C domain-containing protein [Fimbriimonadaceae bacterium]